MEHYLKAFVYSPTEPFLFTQPAFWIFFFVVFSIFSLLYRNIQVRNSFLFIASLFFYYKTGGLFVLLLIISILINYTIGIKLFRSKTLIRRRTWLTSGIVINLFILLYYKYIYFFTGIMNTLFHSNIEIKDYFAVLGNSVMNTHLEVATIVLPVGISFFTFQALSYVIDIYRSQVKPVKSIVDFGFYISFFPQLVAGPIIRASEFIPQISRKFSLTKNEFGHAVFLILNGLIKKMIISDFISLNFVDRVFDAPQLYSSIENIMAVYGYAFQIYCDFSGYTDIAIGLAMLLGFRIPINFNSPYKAISLVDFWRRWHISLSTWLRDYLYISLGGNRKGKMITQLNVLITMLIGGLWHGANIKFIVWGMLHGAGLVINKVIASLFSKQLRIPIWQQLCGGFLTFHFVCFAWIFFRAENMEVALSIIRNIASGIDFAIAKQFFSEFAGILAILGLAMTIHWLPARWKEWYRGQFIKLPVSAKFIVIVVVALLIYQFKTSDIQPFIYFQF